MDIKLLKNLIEKLHMIPDHDDEKMDLPTVKKDDPLADLDMAGDAEDEKPAKGVVIDIKSLGADKAPEMADESSDAAEDDDDYKNSDIFKRLSKKA